MIFVNAFVPKSIDITTIKQYIALQNKVGQNNSKDEKSQMFQNDSYLSKRTKSYAKNSKHSYLHNNIVFLSHTEHQSRVKGDCQFDIIVFFT